MYLITLAFCVVILGIDSFQLWFKALLTKYSSLRGSEVSVVIYSLSDPN